MAFMVVIRAAARSALDERRTILRRRTISSLGSMSGLRDGVRCGSEVGCGSEGLLVAVWGEAFAF